MTSLGNKRGFRVGEVIRRALADIFLRGEIMDPELAGISITVPEVRMSPDLRVALCYVIPLGGIGGDALVKKLAQHGSFIRGAVARRVKLRYMPVLRFRFDDSFDVGAAMDRLFASDRVMQDVKVAE